MEKVSTKMTKLNQFKYINECGLFFTSNSGTQFFLSVNVKYTDSLYRLIDLKNLTTTYCLINHYSNVEFYNFNQVKKLLLSFLPKKEVNNITDNLLDFLNKNKDQLK